MKYQIGQKVLVKAWSGRKDGKISLDDTITDCHILVPIVGFNYPSTYVVNLDQFENVLRYATRKLNNGQIEYGGIKLVLPCNFAFAIREAAIIKPQCNDCLWTDLGAPSKEIYGSLIRSNIFNDY